MKTALHIGDGGAPDEVFNEDERAPPELPDKVSSDSTLSDYETRLADVETLKLFTETGRTT